MKFPELYAAMPSLRYMSIPANLFAMNLVNEYGLSAMRHEIEKMCFEKKLCQNCKVQQACETFKANQK